MGARPPDSEVYAQPSSIGNAAKFSFGTDENRKSAGRFPKRGSVGRAIWGDGALES